MKRDACASSRVRSNWCGCGIAAVIAFLLLLSASNAHGQVTTADVIGTVTDASDAVVPGATVTITNIGTSASQTAVTSGTGEYIFNLLQVGTYTLKVEAKGFKTFRTPSISLSSADRARVDAKLEVGDVTQTVEVQAASAPRAANRYIDNFNSCYRTGRGRCPAEWPQSHEADPACAGGESRSAE